MTKQSGGTRRYDSSSVAYRNRRDTYDSLLATGDYKESYFDESGGYYLIHKEHNEIRHTGELGEGKDNDNREDFAAKVLAQRGYKAYIMGERSYIDGVKKSDGFVDHAMIDFKTINSAGIRTIDKALAKASEQGVNVAVLIQNTPKADKSYVLSQLKKFTDNTPIEKRGNLTHVWVIGLNRKIHRHKL